MQASEILDDAELAAIIGAKSAQKQMEWLASRGWQYEVNAARKPIVGRVYARLKLAGVKPTPETATAQPWTLDLSRVE